MESGDKFYKVPAEAAAAREHIIAATLTYDGTVYEGASHVEALDKLRSAHPDWSESGKGFHQGFKTSTGRVVSRKEATGIAARAKQIRELTVYETIKAMDGLHHSDLDKGS